MERPLLLLTDRIHNPKHIILLHFLIMLESMPCRAQRLLPKAEFIRYRTPPPGFTPISCFSPVKDGPLVSAADGVLGLVTLEQLR